MTPREVPHPRRSAQQLRRPRAGRAGAGVAARIGEYPDGVWLAELAGLADPELVVQSVASATGVRESAGESLRATLLAGLRSRRLLLVLDNCEHLVMACAELADAILRACPSLRILATSREPLGIAGELAWRVPSLSVAPMEHALPPDQLNTYEAVRLFVDRAAFAEAAFRLNEQNARAITQICRRLDGIPRAAQRVTALSVEQIAERLDERFQLLKEDRAIACCRTPTGDKGFGATLRHDSARSGKAEFTKVEEETRSRAA